MHPTESAVHANWDKLTQTAPALWTGLKATLARFDQTPDVDALNQAAQQLGICNAQNQPIRFELQTTPCGQRDYERHIFERGVVLTREGLWHDRFNACMWLTYPAIKAALNAVHLRQPAPSSAQHASAQRANTQHTNTQRSSASDAATVFDESGAILIGPDARLVTWLKDHDWQSAFVTHRHVWETHHLLVIGHAVLEKLAAPYPGMITKVLYQPWPAVSRDTLTKPPAGLDQAVAARWQRDELTKPADLFALPVFGVPGTDPANQDPRYYANTEVFRPKRSKQRSDA